MLAIGRSDAACAFAPAGNYRLDALFFAAFAAAINKTRLEVLLQRALVQIQGTFAARLQRGVR